MGNRLSSLGVAPYSYNSSNELTSTPSVGFTYDNNGNTTSQTDTNGTTTYAWDFENRLTGVTLPGSGGTVSFQYDPFGRRIEKVAGAGTTVYAYDGDNIVEELDGSGMSVARYAQGLWIDEPLALNRSAVISFYEADGLGSVTSLTDGSGQIAASYTYDSFGNVTASTGTLSNSFQYTGRELDSETGLYYYRARYYEPATGRFNGEDPIGISGGTNSYAYVEGNPLNRIDPTGFDWIEYTGQTLTVWPGRFKDRGHPPLLRCKATSGFPGYQSSALQNEDLGPVHEGHYFINLSLSPKRWASIMPTGENLYSAFGVQRIRPTYLGPNGQTLVPEGWGTWRARLEPRSRVRPGNFYLHDSTKGYTHGCVETCSNLYNLFVTYHDQGLAGIDVLVDYTTSSTNGGTRKP